jgi:8-oxo-dGTP diphosphatase
MPVDRLWYLASEAEQSAEQVYHRLADRHDDYLEIEHSRRVSRDRFRTLTERVADCGSPFGAHTIVYRDSGELLLCRHAGVDLWVPPGGGPDGDETLREAAERELAEEAGVEVRFDGLGILTRVEFSAGSHSAWGVMPLYEARAETLEPEVSDPDGEIADARWFDELPGDTRDREDLVAWRERRFDI